MKRLPPRPDVDALVREYVDEMRSRPPPAEAGAAREALLARMPRERQESGSWHVEDFARIIRQNAEKQAADKLSEEIQKRRDAESRLEKLLDERRRWWLDLTKSVVAALVIAALLFAVRQLVR